MDTVVSTEDVLRVIERTRGYEVGSLWIDRGEVWRRDEDDHLTSLCAVDSELWLAYRAAELACRALMDAKGAPLTMPLREPGGSKQ